MLTSWLWLCCLCMARDQSFFSLKQMKRDILPPVFISEAAEVMIGSQIWTSKIDMCSDASRVTGEIFYAVNQYVINFMHRIRNIMHFESQVRYFMRKGKTYAQ